VTHPNLLGRFNWKFKGANNKRIKNWGKLPRSQHFGGKGACWNSEMGTTKSYKQFDYSFGPA